MRFFFQPFYQSDEKKNEKNKSREPSDNVFSIIHKILKRKINIYVIGNFSHRVSFILFIILFTTTHYAY